MAEIQKSPSWWEGQPQIGFSDRCVERYGFGFDAGKVSEPFTEPKEPTGRKFKRVVGSMLDARREGYRPASKRGATSSISTRAMQGKRPFLA